MMLFYPKFLIFKPTPLFSLPIGMMETENLTQLLIIAPPGRLRENLTAMANSVLTAPAIKIVDSCQMAEDRFGRVFPALVLIDFREPPMELLGRIEEIQAVNPATLFVFLQAGLGQMPLFSRIGIREVIYGEISGEMLHQMVEETNPARSKD